MRLNLVQGWGCQGLQAMAPTTEPAMTPGFAAPLEEPDAASLEGRFVVGGTAEAAVVVPGAAAVVVPGAAAVVVPGAAAVVVPTSAGAEAPALTSS